MLPSGEVGCDLLLQVSANQQPLYFSQAKKSMGAGRIPPEERPLPTRCVEASETEVRQREGSETERHER